MRQKLNSLVELLFLEDAIGDFRRREEKMPNLIKYSKPLYAASDTLDLLWKESSPRVNWLNKPLKNILGHHGLKKGNTDHLMNFKENLKNSTGLIKDNNKLKDTKLSKQVQDPGNFKEKLDGYNLHDYKYIGMLKKRKILIQYLF